jgi:hypothetical protein
MLSTVVAADLNWSGGERVRSGEGTLWVNYVARTVTTDIRCRRNERICLIDLDLTFRSDQVASRLATRLRAYRECSDPSGGNEKVWEIVGEPANKGKDFSNIANCARFDRQG